jgi:hypothetical protein
MSKSIGKGRNFLREAAGDPNTGIACAYRVSSQVRTVLVEHNHIIMGQTNGKGGKWKFQSNEEQEFSIAEIVEDDKVSCLDFRWSHPQLKVWVCMYIGYAGREWSGFGMYECMYVSAEVFGLRRNASTKQLSQYGILTTPPDDQKTSPTAHSHSQHSKCLQPIKDEIFLFLKRGGEP